MRRPVGIEFTHTYGSDVDGNPSAQANAAEGFLSLQYACCDVARTYYYEFQTAPGDTFDSAVLASDGSSQPQTGDRSNAPLYRPSYCVIADGYSTGTAAGTPSCNDYAHSPPDPPDYNWESTQ